MNTPKLWASAVAVALFGGGTLLGFSLANNGLALVRRGHTFVLRQGYAERPLNQAIGAVLYTAEIVALIAGFLAVLLSTLLFVKAGTLRATTLLSDRTPSDRALLKLLRLSKLYAVVIVGSCLAYALIVRFLR